MRKLLLAALVLLPCAAWADHLDVISFQLKDGCTLEQYVAIKDDFNSQWGKAHNYQTEIAVPLQSPDLTTYYWIGRSADAATYGKAYDVWREESRNPSSIAGKLAARFAKCGTELDRRSYDVY